MFHTGKGYGENQSVVPPTPHAPPEALPDPPREDPAAIWPIVAWPLFGPPHRRYHPNLSYLTGLTRGWITETYRRPSEQVYEGIPPRAVLLAALACRLPDKTGTWQDQDEAFFRHLPRELDTDDVVMEWWAYLESRWRTFGEWPDPLTQVSTLQVLADWRRPDACLREARASSYKGVFPLRSDIEAGLYERQRTIVLATSRTARRHDGRGATVRDTVTGYVACKPAQASSRRP